jgi:hypothetical protein
LFLAVRRTLLFQPRSCGKAGKTARRQRSTGWGGVKWDGQLLSPQQLLPPGAVEGALGGAEENLEGLWRESGNIAVVTVADQFLSHIHGGVEDVINLRVFAAFGRLVGAQFVSNGCKAGRQFAFGLQILDAFFRIMDDGPDALSGPPARGGAVHAMFLHETHDHLAELGEAGQHQ